jgi:hypothetical protein
MPEIFLRVSWPDGSSMRCCSPSLVVEAIEVKAASLPVAALVTVDGFER